VRPVLAPELCGLRGAVVASLRRGRESLAVQSSMLLPGRWSVVKMAKLRRKADRLSAEVVELSGLLERGRAAWRGLRAELDRVEATRRAEQLEGVQSRRKDLARVAAIHHKVLRRAVGRGRAERFYCEECNVPFPCRTMDVLGRLGEALDETYRSLQAPAVTGGAR
jgi:hypothetical protein